MIAPDRDGNLEYVYGVDIDKDRKLVIAGSPVQFSVLPAAIRKEWGALVGHWELCLRRHRRKRSQRQNRTQYMYFNILSDHTGHTPREIKGWAQYELLRVEEVDPDTGEVFMRIRDTSELNTQEHNHWMEDFRNWAQKKFNCHLPLPDHTLAMDFREKP